MGVEGIREEDKMREVEEELMSRNGSKLINQKRREDMMVENTKV